MWRIVYFSLSGLLELGVAFVILNREHAYREAAHFEDLNDFIAMTRGLRNRFLALFALVPFVFTGVLFVQSFASFAACLLLLIICLSFPLLAFPPRSKKRGAGYPELAGRLVAGKDENGKRMLLDTLDKEIRRNKPSASDGFTYCLYPSALIVLSFDIRGLPQVIPTRDIISAMFTTTTSRTSKGATRIRHEIHLYDADDQHLAIVSFGKDIDAAKLLDTLIKHLGIKEKLQR